MTVDQFILAAAIALCGALTLGFIYLGRIK
jgi:hypothetical protein